MAGTGSGTAAFCFKERTKMDKSAALGHGCPAAAVSGHHREQLQPDS